MALDMGASRVEIAHVQYYGWALKNRAALMPTRQQVEEAVGRIEPLRKQHHGRIVIDAVVPDYFARFPKPCVGGWGPTLAQRDAVRPRFCRATRLSRSQASNSGP